MEEVETEDNEECVGLGCSLERFLEWQEILNLIENLGNLHSCNEVERAYERFRFIVNQYKEQPHLIDSHLPVILDKILEKVRQDEAEEDSRHRAFQYMYLITNVRGYKIIVQQLPHAACDLEPVLVLLEKQNYKEIETWQTRYCLLLWLSIIVKIPFHMSRLDASDGSANFKPIMERILDICKLYLMHGDSCRIAAAFLSSHFLTRSDIKELYLEHFFEWACDSIMKGVHWESLGPLSAIAAILKLGKRDDLLPHASWLLQKILLMKWKEQEYRLNRKYALKIIQRIGLTFLKARVVSWRYQRGNRSLIYNLNLSSGDSFEVKEPDLEKADAPSEDDDQEVPEEIEEIIEELMQGLRDRDITIRWSAAKGIGRIMGRMRQSLGDEVIGCVLELLGPRENDSAWHGGCLALAELSKRGLLLPARLSEVIPLIKKALVYDEPRGYTSVGTHIRDAACYVAWTFARAYDSQVFKPFVNDMANALIIVACFDREINIRRAASAAFQEHIGRQGSFPHGIEIMTTADYYSVGVRNNAYLNISVFVAKFEEYTLPMIDHLVEKKINHWDIAIRELASKALHNLTPLTPQYMIEIVLPTLLQKTNELDVNVRHGSIIATGEVVHALFLLPNITFVPGILSAIKDLLRVLRERHQLKGINGELMKIGFCQLINKCSLAKLPFHGQPVIGEWQNLIDECLCHEVSNMRTKAAEALLALSSEYYQNDGVADMSMTTNIITNYSQKLGGNDEVTRLGHALALGALPQVILVDFIDIIVSGLINCATMTFQTEKWVESRRAAIKALTDVCTTVGIENQGGKPTCRGHLESIIICMLEGLRDYTKDKRGDTGAWVRESSMSGLQALIKLGAVYAPELLTEELITSAMCSIAQQAVERIDRVRALAGYIFSNLLHNDPPIPHIPEREQVLEIFPFEACKSEINWLSQHDTFPRFTQLIALKAYSYKVMEGIIMSVGGLSESLVKASSSCFFSYLNSQPLEELIRLCDIITQIYETNVKVERIVLPMLNFLELLFSSGTISRVLEASESNFPNKVFSLTKTAVFGSTNKFKLLGSVDVYCQLVQVNSSVRQLALKRIMVLLNHKFGWLRKSAASKFYEALMIYGDELNLPEDSYDQILNVLSETEWNAMTQDQVKPLIDQLSLLFNISAPTSQNKKT